MILIDPRNIKLQDWCNFMIPPLSEFGQVPILEGNNWQNWGLAICQLPEVSQRNPPNPLYFSEWQDWAFRLNEVLP